MVNRNGEKGDNPNFNENDPDPTKEAFFSDMGDIEKEIASEAFELVKHALSLVESQFFDDSIEILRQAIGLYSQINRESEVEAIKGKISEIYLLREESFKKRELETKDEFESIQGEEISEQDEQSLYNQADSLIVEAIEFVNNRNFDQALDTYDDAISILKKLNKRLEIEKINELIEDCYNRKADYLRKQKSSPIEEDNKGMEASGNFTSELDLKAKKLKAYEDAKKKENELSNQAYELIGKATEMRRIRQFDEAIGLFEKSILLFKEINWLDEVKKIENMKEHVERDKEKYKLELQQIRAREEQELEEKKKQEAQLIERSTIEENLKQKAQAVKIRKQIEIKQEEEIFQNNLADMIDYAEKLAREYELDLKKAINKGNIVKECAYPSVIKIYEEVRDKTKEKGWKDQVKLYEDQIQHYQILLEKDKKLRHMEAQKIQKQKLFDESQKITKDTMVAEIDPEKLKTLKEQKRKEIEIEKLKGTLTDSVKMAEKMAREYEVAFKKAAKSGNLNIASKYPEILKMYTDAKDKALEKGWNEDAAMYSSQIRKYTELAERDTKIREIEAKKNQDQKTFEEYRKVQKESVDIEKLTQLEKQRITGTDDKKFQLELIELVERAEKMARDYEIALRKGLKKGKLIEESPFSKIIGMYNQIRDSVISKGWKDQIAIYTNQVKIYQEKWEKDKKLRELELQKIQKQKEFDDSLKVRTDSAITPQRLKDLEFKRKLESEEQDFQKEITELVEKAEKMARNYEMEMKKALKEGKLLENSPYLEIIEIYTRLRKRILEKGWTDQGLIYTNQIKIYQDKLEKDKKLRKIESEKVKKQQEFIEAQKAPTVYDGKKLRKIEELTKQEQEEEIFEKEIDKIIENAEKEAREYELAIMKGQFDKTCPFLKIAEIYQNLRKKVYARGWKEEAEIYTNQIILYQAKFQKDERLRKLEIQKAKKQQEFEESLKAPTEIKPLRLEELDALNSKNRENDEIMTQALNLIDEAEKAVRNYEVSLKRDILSYESPYEEVINMYATASKMLQKIGWNEEAQKLNNTISFYESKKLKDENLRAFELQKIEKSKIRPVLVAKDDHLIQEMRIDELKKSREAKSKESEEIFNKLSQAEKMAKDYDIKKKEGTSIAISPFKEIIQIYKTAKLDFEKIGWVEQADQLVNSINYYQKKFDEFKRLRALELERVAKQEEETKRFENKVQEAQKAKEELSLLRIKELEEKRKRTVKYESKKERAFNFMDLAKRELKQNNFDKAIKFYKESLQIFDEINWPEGRKMTKESINAIKLKKQRLEREEKLLAQKKREKIRIEAQLEEQITKAKDLHDLQQEQRRRELSAIQEGKEREREISDKAYLLLETGTKLKDDKKFEEAYEKYIMGRDLFKKVGWEHEVSRINNDLMITLKKEMKQTEKLKAYQEKKEEEKEELEELLKEAEEKQKELDQIRKEEKKKQREKLIQKERDKAHEIIKNLKYNEGILALRKVIKKIEHTDQDKMIKEMKKQIEMLENASQVPIITNVELDRDENFAKFRLAYQALDKAQISLSNNLFMKAITELNEAIFNLTETKIGKRFILEIEDKINIYKKELDIKKEPEVKKVSPKLDEEDLRAKIAKRREERRKRIKDL
ncbi:MAG: hypothetical protein E3J90_00950 [Promethearchaeota archaeon]|nr:MAG: hypothetical protein E3J90_00950 [Candidatus Lokiarchaeota archaeon]